MASLHKHIVLIQLLNIALNLRQLLLIPLFPSLEPNRVDHPDVSQLLVLLVDLVPLALEPLPKGMDLFLGEGVLLHLVLLVQVADHLVLVFDVLFYLVEVVRGLPVVLLLRPLDWLGGALGHGQDVLDCVSDYEVLAGLQALDGLLVDCRHGGLLVLAVVGEVLGHWQLLVTHRPRVLFQKLFRLGLTIALELA